MEEVKLSLPATYSMLKLLLKVFENLTYRFSFLHQKEHEIVTSLIEAFNNCVEHAYGGESPNRKVDISFRIYSEKDKSKLEIFVTDYGKGFNPDSYEEYVPTKKEHLYRNRGRGIFIIKNFMDSFAIEPLPNGGTTIKMESTFHLSDKAKEGKK